MKKCGSCKQNKEITEYFTDIKGMPLKKCKKCLINGTNDNSIFCSNHSDTLAAYNAGKKYKDIALEKGVSINTIKTWIRRGRLNIHGINN